jgi:vacuolar-type H+-ATPase subunit E/Vma4
MSETSSGIGQDQGQVGELAGQAQEKVQEAAQQVRTQAGTQVREQVDTRSTQAGQQVRSVADALRKTATDLREQDQQGVSRFVEGAADRVERLGSYLEQSNADGILDEVESFARRQPWVVGAGAFAVGLVASRFLKASSSNRYQQHRRTGFRSWEADQSWHADQSLARDRAETGLTEPPRTHVGPEGATTTPSPTVTVPEGRGY